MKTCMLWERDESYAGDEMKWVTWEACPCHRNHWEMNPCQSVSYSPSDGR